MLGTVLAAGGSDVSFPALTMLIVMPALGALLIALIPAAIVAPVFMLLSGVTVGMMKTISGALWPELYGVRHLGAIRSVTMALAVFATALAPWTVGLLADMGVSMSAQMLAMGAYTLVVSGILWHVMRVIQAARSGAISGPTDTIGSA